LKGKTEKKKDLPEIMVAHHIPYVATASMAFPEDYVKKLEKGRDMGCGFKYIHVHSPCPTGWRFPERKTIEVSRLAVECGLWILYEVIYDQYQITYRPKVRRPVEDYLKTQGRFAHLTREDMEKIQRQVEERWQALE
jgi:pyruvate/2-oxoacid:ferredoxin oxidoreductase beta subunit